MRNDIESVPKGNSRRHVVYPSPSADGDGEGCAGVAARGRIRLRLDLALLSMTAYRHGGRRWRHGDAGSGGGDVGRTVFSTSVQPVRRD